MATATRQPAPKPYWQVFQASDDSWYFQLRRTDHVPVLFGGYGGVYATEEDARETVQWVKDNAPTADGP